MPVRFFRAARGPGALVATAALAVVSMAVAGLPAGDAADAVPQPRDVNDSCPVGMVPEDGFTDVSSADVHEPNVDCVVWWQVAAGTAETTYGPSAPVRRDQMASFVANLVVRSGGTLPVTAPDPFTDVTGDAHEADINQLAAAGIVAGYADHTYRPGEPVTRAQMATYLVRAYQYRSGYTLTAVGDYFTDDAGDAHEADINKAAAAGFTGGTATGGYAPLASVARDQMATFLARVLDLLVENGAPLPPAVSVRMSQSHDPEIGAPGVAVVYAWPASLNGHGGVVQLYENGVVRGRIPFLAGFDRRVNMFFRTSTASSPNALFAVGTLLDANGNVVPGSQAHSDTQMWSVVVAPGQVVG